MPKSKFIILIPILIILAIGLYFVISKKPIDKTSETISRPITNKTSVPKINDEMVEEKEDVSETAQVKEGEVNIVIATPYINQLFQSPDTIKGKANILDGDVWVRIKDKDGDILGQTSIPLTKQSEGIMIEFETEIEYEIPATEYMEIEAYQLSAEDNREINLTKRPLKFYNPNRILLEPKKIQDISSLASNEEMCNEQFNLAKANATVDYTSQDRGISFTIPYNKSWGNTKYKIKIYDEYKNENDIDCVGFGPIGVFDNCAWKRIYLLGFLANTNAEDLIEGIMDEYSNLLTFMPYKTYIENSLSQKLIVVKYEFMAEDCLYPTIQVIGKKYNYQLRSNTCGTGIDFENLENIIKSILIL